MTLSTDMSAKPSIGPRAMREAEQWLSRMDVAGHSPQEQLAFERWREHPEHAAAYEKIERFWQAFGQFPEHPEVLRLVDRTSTETAAGNRFRSPFTLALAASVAVCVLAVGTFAAGRYYVPSHTYTTEFGQRSTVTLDDGSQVILNSASRLKVKFGREKREFTLKQGEAVFTASNDSLRPFVVLAGDGEVTALGTQFQVRNESKTVVVTLLEGKIALDRQETKQHLRLEPGEQVTFRHDEKGMARHTVDPEIALSWTTGRLRFKNAALADLLNEVNRYSTTQIRLGDPSLVNTPISATLEMGNSNAAVTALEALLPVQAMPQGRNQIVLVRRPSSENR